MCFFRKRRKRKEQEKEQELKNKSVKHDVVEEEKEEVQKVEAKATNQKQEVKPAEATNTKAAKYHVSQNKDEKSEFFKQWRVRKQGSQKTIKYFNTQAEAIDFAQDLADKAGSSIVIHKLDGSIRKQDYTKK